MTPTISIVLPMRNRPIVMLARTLAAIRWQNPAYPVEVIVVSNGDEPKHAAKLRTFCSRPDVNVRLVEINSGVWNKPRTSNVGLRAANPDSPYLMAMDVDILLAPDFFDAIFETSKLDERFILCQVGELPDGITYPEPFVVAGYATMKKRATWHGRTHGIGGVQFAPRKFWHDVRGYDEDMTYWGSMDSDMADRAVRYRLKKTWLNKATSMLHQPHVKKGRILATQALQDDAMRAHAENRKLRHGRAAILVRNPNGWGEM